MSGIGRYPLGIPSLADSFLGSSQRRDRLDYDDRRFRERERDRRDDDYRRDSGGLRGRSSRDRFSPEPSYSSSSYDDLREGSHSDLVSYPLGHLGGSRSDRGGGRNERNRNQNRDRYRNNNNNNRSQGSRGTLSNQGPGILGAKPGDRSVPELPANPMQVPALGMAGGGLGTGLTAQLAQQQQQLMAMVQTQSLLAAMQAQANANAQAQVQARAKQGMQSPMGLLPTPLIPRNQSRDMQRQNRKRGRNDGWGGGGNQGNKRERFDHFRSRQQGGGYRQQQNRNRPNQQSQQAKKAATPDKQETKKEETTEEELQEEEDDAVQGDEETEDLNTTLEEDEKLQGNEVSAAPEFNDRPLPKAVNFVGEDVDALMISLFDKKRSKYICQQCKIICNIPMSFHKHLLGKRHARTVLEKQGKELDGEEFRNFTQETTSVKKIETEDVAAVLNAEEDKVHPPELSSLSSDEVNLDFVKYSCDTRKTAMKEGNIITISSVTHSRVKIDGFTSERNALGCEFVKAVSGFNCRLCKTFIRCGNDVINHIKGKKHQNNYKTYIQEHPQYEEHQMARNKELEAVLEPKEGEEVVLYEVLDKDLKSASVKTLSHYKDSQAEQSDEVQITRFVVAPQSSDQEDQLHGEAADLNVDIEGVDHVNEDSLVTDESFEELRETTATGTDEGEALYDPAECTSVDESQESQLETAVALAQPKESEEFIPLSVDTAVNSELEEAKEPMSTTPRRASNQWKERDNDSESSSQEDAEETPAKEVTPTARRGKKGVRGGASRGGAARGKGRGRGARRSARAPAGGKAGKAKKAKAKEDADNTDDVNFIEGFEVIDEIGDGED